MVIAYKYTTNLIDVQKIAAFFLYLMHQTHFFHVAIELLNVSLEIGKRPPVSGIESTCSIYKTN